MTHERNQNKLVLSVSPFPKGFGYAVFEGPLHPIDRGVKEAKGDKNAVSLRKLEGLIDFFEPEVLVLDDPSAKGFRRGTRIRSLLALFATLTAKKKIKTKRYSRAAIRHAFGAIGAVTKFEISRSIAAQWPELQPWLPPVRKPWMSEDARMSIFDAVALTVTFFYSENENEREAK